MSSPSRCFFLLLLTRSEYSTQHRTGRADGHDLHFSNACGPGIVRSAAARSHMRASVGAVRCVLPRARGPGCVGLLGCDLSHVMSCPLYVYWLECHGFAVIGSSLAAAIFYYHLDVNLNAPTIFIVFL